MSRSSSRARRVLSVVGAVSSLVAPPLAGAVAAPELPVVPGEGPGRSTQNAPPTQRIRNAMVSLETRTGRWTTTVRFRTPRTTANDAELSIGLGFYGDPVYSGEPTLTVRTAPGAPAPTYQLVAPPTPPATEPVIVPSPVVPTITYDASRTVLSLSVRDTSLAGRRRPEVVRGALSPVGDPDREFSGFYAPMGAPAPRATIDRGNDAIVVHRSGRFSLRLHSLPAAAEQQIIVFLPGGYTLASAALPASAYRHRTVSVRVERPKLHRLQPGGNPHRAILRIVTYQRYGVATTSLRHVTIRRR